MTPHHRKLGSHRKLDDIIEDAARSLGGLQPYFWRLIRSIRAHSTLLKTAPFTNSIRSQAEAVAVLCVRLAAHHSSWIRKPEDWGPDHDSPFLQLRSLICHLFAVYQVPNCMTSMWLGPQLDGWIEELYFHLALGRSIRGFELPVPFRLSKSGAAWFMRAPDDLNPIHAIRWAQVRSLGGDSRIGRVLATKTLLSRLTNAEVYWESVFRFLIRNDPITESEMMAIVQFVDQQRFQPAANLLGEWYGQAPIQPNFSIQGRSLMSLRHHMTNWRSEVQIAPIPFVRRPATWERTAIDGYRGFKGECFWSIDELVTSHEIHEEAHHMKHCVASYVGACIRRRTSIWSMVVRKGDRSHRLLTIEVAPDSKEIRQAKGKRNAFPCKPALEVLREWASQEGLKLREPVV